MGKYKKYTPDQLKQAIDDAKPGKSIRSLEKLHKINRMTISRHQKGLLKGHPVRVLSKVEEEQLVAYIVYCQARAMPLTRKVIKSFVRGIVSKSGRQLSGSGNGPSNKWFRSFLSRHPRLSMKSPQLVDGGRTRMSNETVMAQHFKLLSETIEKLGLGNKPECIFNVDETGFGKGMSLDKVCVADRRQAQSRVVVTSNHTTANVCVSADGRVLPTMVIYEKSFPSGMYRDGIPQSWLFGTSENGYMDSDLFRKWFQEIFLKHVPRSRPILLVLDNHESHLSIPLIDMARANQIEFFCLPPHTTHLLQPLDVALFRPLKKAVSDLAVSLSYVNKELIIGKHRLAQVLQAAVDKVFSPHNIKAGFRKCGIFPFDKDAIDKSQLAPKDPEFDPINNMGPGGDNNSSRQDPLCHSCGQFVMGHPLVTQGIIPKELADVLVPIIGPPKQNRATRIITEARVITGEQIYEQLKEKEEKRKPKPNKQKPRRESNESAMTNTGKELDVEQAPKKRIKKGKHHVETELPKLHVPKKRVRKPKIVIELTSNNIKEELADPEFTCPICNIQGHTSDEESGIFWVGCDNARCSRWYHRECLTHDQHSDVDLSLLTGGTWHCHLCQNDGILHLEDMPCTTTTHEVICQVCMLSYTGIEIRDGIDLFWIKCKCGKSYHKSCLPSYVYRQLDLTKEAWRCGHCPDNIV